MSPSKWGHRLPIKGEKNMAIQPAICVNCGGKLNVDDVDLNGFCECTFCHSAHKVIDIITIDGLPTVKTLLMDAELCIEDSNLEKAVKLFEEIIKVKPNCHEAWWGLYICNDAFDEYYGYKDKYGNSGPQTKAAIMKRTIDKYANRAIEFAPPEQADRYSELIKDKVDFISSVHSGAYDTPKATGEKGGCYIATAVYGSYFCDEVIALRRYRDDYLAKSKWGRLFIRFYYAVSPQMAKHIKQDSLISKSIKKILDKKIEKLIL